MIRVNGIEQAFTCDPYDGRSKNRSYR